MLQGCQATFIEVFQPTPSARRVTVLLGVTETAISISTHTLRKEGDDTPFVNVFPFRLISTHTLRKEGDS